MTDTETPQPYILVHLVEERSVGERFLKTRSGWPLHITLVPWFYVAPSRLEELKSRLSAYARSATPFTAVVGEEKFFGPNHDIGVNVIADQKPMYRIHRNLRQIVEVCADGYRENATPAAGIGSVYDAHITHHDVEGVIHRRFQGDEEIFDAITMATYFATDQGLMCEVVENFTLGTND